jgi:hypothetical protein
MMNTFNLVQGVLNPAKVVLLFLLEKKKNMKSLVKIAFYSQATKSRGKAIFLASPRVPFM